MDRAKEIEKKLQIEINLSLGRMHEKYISYVLESSLQEMRELQKGNPQIENIPFLKPREEEEIDIGKNIAY